MLYYINVFLLMFYYINVFFNQTLAVFHQLLGFFITQFLTRRFINTFLYTSVGVIVTRRKRRVTIPPVYE